MLTSRLLCTLFGARWWCCGFVGTLLNIAGNVQKASAAAQAAQFNQGQATAEAAQVGKVTAQKVEAANTNEALQLGSVRAAYGASGVTMSGSAADSIASAAGMLNRKVAAIGQAGQFEQQKLMNEASQYGTAAGQDLVGGAFGATAAGVTGFEHDVETYGSLG